METGSTQSYWPEHRWATGTREGLSFFPLLRPSTPPHWYVGCDPRNFVSCSSFKKSEERVTKGAKLCLPNLSDLEVEIPFLHKNVCTLAREVAETVPNNEATQAFEDTVSKDHFQICRKD